MKKIKTKQNKKAVSLIVSYTLLIVITLTLAAGIGAWLKFRAKLPDDSLKCPDGLSLAIMNYNCSDTTKILTLDVKNKGRFTIAGFFILGSNNTALPATTPLDKEGTPLTDPGRYDFIPSGLGPEKSEEAKFSYLNIPPLEKIQVQPFILKNNNPLLCDSIIYLDLDNARGCSTP